MGLHSRKSADRQERACIALNVRFAAGAWLQRALRG